MGRLSMPSTRWYRKGPITTDLHNQVHLKGTILHKLGTDDTATFLGVFIWAQTSTSSSTVVSGLWMARCATPSKTSCMAAKRARHWWMFSATWQTLARSSESMSRSHTVSKTSTGANYTGNDGTIWSHSAAIKAAEIAWNALTRLYSPRAISTVRFITPTRW